MSPLEISRVVRAFSFSSLNGLINGLRNHEGITIIGPLKVFISVKLAKPGASYPSRDPLDHVKLVTYVKDVIDMLIIEGFIANHEQITEIGIEKQRGEENEIMVLLQE